jgi:hypothetical protein
MIVSMRRLAQRGGVLFAICLAVLGIVVLLHLGLCVITAAAAAPQQERGPNRPAATCGTNAELHAVIATAASQSDTPCPRLPAGDDHRLCGAAAGSPIVNARVLLPSGHAIGDSTAAETAATASSAPARRSSRPVCLPPGAELLLLKSVSRI